MTYWEPSVKKYLERIEAEWIDQQESEEESDKEEGFLG